MLLVGIPGEKVPEPELVIDTGPELQPFEDLAEQEPVFDVGEERDQFSVPLQSVTGFGV